MQSLQRETAALAQFELKLGGQQTYLGHIFPLQQLPGPGFGSNMEKPQLSTSEEEEGWGNGMVGQE